MIIKIKIKNKTVHYRFIPETKTRHITIFSRFIDLSKTYIIYNCDLVRSCTTSSRKHLNFCFCVGASTYTVWTIRLFTSLTAQESFNWPN